MPKTQQFNEEQLKPGADRAGEGLKTGADRASKGLQNAADQVSQQAGMHCSKLLHMMLHVVINIWSIMTCCQNTCAVVAFCTVNLSRSASKLHYGMAFEQRGSAPMCGVRASFKFVFGSVLQLFHYQSQFCTESSQVLQNMYCTYAEPTAKKFTEGQLKPAADKVAANAKPTADRFNNEQLLPAADKIAQNAKPTADKLTEGQIKPAAQKIHDEAVPRTKDFTEGTLQPGAKRLADNAEPMADKLIKQGVEPLADVRTLPASCFCLHCSLTTSAWVPSMLPLVHNPRL